jgi:uncharacterized protein involved in exopolysaccharide biosynthesis
MSAADNYDDEIDLRALWQKLWAARLLIVATAIVFAAGSAIYAKLLPNKYTAEVVMVPAPDEQNATGLPTRLGGLASLAGFGRSVQVDNVTLAQEIIKSRAFTTHFIRSHHLEIPLMATKGWDKKNHSWIIDSEKYDENAKKWVRKVKPPKTPEPSDWELYKVFSKKISISSEKLTGLIRINMVSLSPEAAKQWLDFIVIDINDHMRKRDIDEAQKSILYLQRQLEKTSVTNMEQVFYQLIEQQTKTMMLAEARTEYTLKIIDPAVVPEEKSGPKRALIVAGATVAGLVLGIFIVLIWAALRDSRIKQ